MSDVHPWTKNEARLRRRIFWVAFLLRVAYITLAHTYRIRPVEGHFQFGWEMGRIAQALATGFGYADPFEGHTGPTAWSPPLYVFLIAGAFKLFGVYSALSAWFILAVNSLMSASTAVAVWEIARRCFNARVALWSGWIWALYPAAMQFAVRWIWEMSATAWLFAWIFVLALRMRYDERGQIWLRWCCFGLLWGVLALTSPTPCIMLPVLGLWLVFHAQRKPQVLAKAVVSGVLFCAVIAPWAIRNWNVFHRFIPLRGNFGAENYMGNGPWSVGFPWGATVRFEDRALLREYATVGEPVWVADRGEKAKVWIATHHKRYMELNLKRAYMFWFGVPHPYEHGVAGMIGEWVRLISFQFISLAGWFGIVLAMRERKPAAWMMFFCVLLMPITYYLVTVQARFRHVLEPILCVAGVYLFQSAEPGNFGRAGAAKFAWLGRLVTPLKPFFRGESQV
ncbi:MAG: glycosyltransferase family 39 protein [Acidobacteria bacterium]|nr:glycosyltransferase family 39 protein [Acidobacteriota bacterium]